MATIVLSAVGASLGAGFGGSVLGLSGAVMATALARAGVKVTCLEQGVRWHAEDYRGRHEDWELASFGPWRVLQADQAHQGEALFDSSGIVGREWLRERPPGYCQHPQGIVRHQRTGLCHPGPVAG